MGRSFTPTCLVGMRDTLQMDGSLQMGYTNIAFKASLTPFNCSWTSFILLASL
jgi:hypothetical protein